MFCQSCGKPLSGGRFCKYCGAPVVRPVQVRQQAPQSPYRRGRKSESLLLPGLRWTACILLSFLLPGYLFLFFFQNDRVLATIMLLLSTAVMTAFGLAFGAADIRPKAILTAVAVSVLVLPRAAEVWDLLRDPYMPIEGLLTNSNRLLLLLLAVEILLAVFYWLLALGNLKKLKNRKILLILIWVLCAVRVGLTVVMVVVRVPLYTVDIYTLWDDSGLAIGLDLMFNLLTGCCCGLLSWGLWKQNRKRDRIPASTPSPAPSPTPAPEV
ncbi:MAG TPA: zinc ribbon domain-containing protein [Firmicutes bacterium]|nr:zinc ribbon domain-containing protein [Bacillota bacterium]